MRFVENLERIPKPGAKPNTSKRTNQSNLAIMEIFISFVVSILLSSASLGQSNVRHFEQAGWTIQGAKSAGESLKVNALNPTKIDSFEIADCIDNLVIQNKIWNIQPSKGMITLNANIAWYKKGSVPPNIYCFARGSSGQNILVSTFNTVESLLGIRGNGNVRITLPFESRLDTITYGLRFEKFAGAKILNFEITLDEGELAPRWEATMRQRLTSDRHLIHGLRSLCVVWGVLKYFSPSISSDNIDWDRVLLGEIESLMLKSTPRTIKMSINRLMRYANKDFVQKASKQNELINQASDAEKINLAFNVTEKCYYLSERDKHRLRKLMKYYQSFDNKYVKDPARIDGPSPVFIENTYNKNELPDANFRLLSLFRYWNVIQYYYPYKYAINVSWPLKLDEFISRFILANTAKEYRRELAQLNASIHDGHATLSNSSLTWATLMSDFPIPIPFKLKIMKSGKALVTGIDSSFSKKTGLRQGMLIDSIDSKSISHMVNFLRGFVSSGRQDTKDLFIEKNNLLSYRDGSDGDSLRLTYHFQGEKKNISLIWTIRDVKDHISFIKSFYNAGEDLGEGYKLVRDKLLYINSYFWKKEDTDTTLKLLRQNYNVIIDTRDYANPDFVDFASKFSGDSVCFVKFMYVSAFPGLLQEINIYRTQDRNGTDFRGKIVVLISESTQSMAEYLTMLLKSGKNNVVLIGRNTAGADGNISTIPMIGNQDLQFSISGLRVLHPDGRETQRIGIKPDFFVEREWRKDFLEQGDPILEKALQHFECN